MLDPLHATENFAFSASDSEVFGDAIEVKFTVYYCLIGIGEALKDVSMHLLASEPTVPWEAVMGMRNRLVHSYWRIDDNIVYEVATLELPALGMVLERLVNSYTSA
jgi:uncharacterized protein with HEPN domain